MYLITACWRPVSDHFKAKARHPWSEAKSNNYYSTIIRLLQFAKKVLIEKENKKRWISRLVVMNSSITDKCLEVKNSSEYQSWQNRIFVLFISFVLSQHCVLFCTCVLTSVCNRHIINVVWWWDPPLQFPSVLEVTVFCTMTVLENSIPDNNWQWGYATGKLMYWQTHHNKWQTIYLAHWRVEELLSYLH